MAQTEVQCPKCKQYNYVTNEALNPYKYRYYTLKCCHCCNETEFDNLNMYPSNCVNHGDYYE